MTEEEYFKPLYNVYLDVFRKSHDECSNPVCYDEWVDNELEILRVAYRRYLKETIIEDDGFDETSTEDFWTFAEEEIKDPLY